MNLVRNYMLLAGMILLINQVAFAKDANSGSDKSSPKVNTRPTIGVGKLPGKSETGMQIEPGRCLKNRP